MREIRTSGSEGGEPGWPGFPTPTTGVPARKLPLRPACSPLDRCRYASSGPDAPAAATLHGFCGERAISLSRAVEGRAFLRA